MTELTNRQNNIAHTLHELEQTERGLTINQKLGFYRKLAQIVAEHEPYLTLDYIKETKNAVRWFN